MHNSIPVFAGTYTEGTQSEGIYRFEFDPESGRFGMLAPFARAENPSYLIRVKGGIACVNERAEGGVSRFSMDGKLTGAHSSKGSAPCHLAENPEGTLLAVANYLDGAVSLYDMTPDGEIRGLRAVLSEKGHGPNPARQESAHAHQCVFIGDELWCADLGIDRIRRYAISGKTIEALAPISLPAGSGPRHLAIDAAHGTAYVVSELSNRLFTLKARKGAYEIIDDTPLLSNPGAKDAAAAIRPARNFGLLLTSIRGSDRVSVFSIGPEGIPLPRGDFDAGGACPRDLLPIGEFLLCACQEGNVIVSHKILRDGTLRCVDCLELPSPVCLLA